MKSLEEIESILKSYSGGPIVLTAAREALTWAKAYRHVAILNTLHLQDAKNDKIPHDQTAATIDRTAKSFCESSELK